MQFPKIHGIVKLLEGNSTRSCFLIIGLPSDGVPRKSFIFCNGNKK